MTPQLSLAQSKAHLDEATENLTFERFDWALEDTWRGAAWALNALLPQPRKEPALEPKGVIPSAGTLDTLLSGVDDPPAAARVISELESFRAGLAVGSSFRTALETFSATVDQLVFRTWALYEACAARFLTPAETEGVYGGRWFERHRVERRTVLRFFALGSLVPLAASVQSGCDDAPVARAQSVPEPSHGSPAPRRSADIRAVTGLDTMQWPTADPFLFCAHHRDAYPEGNASLGPDASLEGRLLGRDFDPAERWRMYHGEVVPGFPRHPHRGFETVTVVRTGLLDHADSMGAAARYGGGDVQWLTAGGGIQHAEMFPLLRADADNPLELFQIWLNLPAADKMVDPYFTMLWNEQIPRVDVRDEAGRAVELTISAGSYDGHRPPPPPPNSWASREESDLAIWNMRMAPSARFDLPAVEHGTERSLYMHRGTSVRVGDREVPYLSRVELEGNGPIALTAGSDDEVEILLLQGRPIGEPVARRGPFVMNTADEIRQAYSDYRRTGFGGWPWPSNDPIHGGEPRRFARHVDGREEEPS